MTCSSPAVWRIPFLLFVAVLAQPALADGWTRFRGPNGSGVAEASGLPVEFGPDRGALWRTEVPFTRSSPIVVNDLVVVSAADEQDLLVLALDQATGAERWRAALKRAHEADIFESNDSASSTPVTDGEHIYVFFQELGLACFDREGTHQWTTELGPFHSFYGIGASPVVARDVVIMNCDQQRGSFLVAIDKSSGEERWRVERELHGESWSTPVLYPANDPEVVIVHGFGWLDAYRIEDGSWSWGTTGLGVAPIPSPVMVGDQLLINVQNEAEGTPPFPTFEMLSGRYDSNHDGWLTKEELGRHFIATHFGWIDVDRDDRFNAEDYREATRTMTDPEFGIRLFDLSDTSNGEPLKESWRHTKKLPKHTTPVLYDGVVYAVTTGGILTSLDVETGAVIKQGRLPEVGGQYYASPVLADGKLYLSNQRGMMSVVRAKGEWEPLARNEFGEFIYATPAIADDRIYIRTEKALYAFGQAGE